MYVKEDLVWELGGKREVVMGQKRPGHEILASDMRIK